MTAHQSNHRARRIGLARNSRPNIRIVRTAEAYPLEWREPRNMRIWWAIAMIATALIGLAVLWVVSL